MKIAYKLLNVRADNSLGPLFIDRGRRLPLNKWLVAEAKPTKGFAFRPGWHCCAKPLAPHLIKTNRVWAKVQITGIKEHIRPARQGGLWYTANRMKILEIVG
jgi:hypothetical protein